MGCWCCISWQAHNADLTIILWRAWGFDIGAALNRLVSICLVAAPIAAAAREFAQEAGVEWNTRVIVPVHGLKALGCYWENIAGKHWSGLVSNVS